jgi:hypothetical protein
MIIMFQRICIQDFMPFPYGCFCRHAEAIQVIALCNALKHYIVYDVGLLVTLTRSRPWELLLPIVENSIFTSSEDAILILKLRMLKTVARRALEMVKKRKHSNHYAITKLPQLPKLEVILISFKYKYCLNLKNFDDGV